MTNFSTIKIEIIDRIAILSLNRPEKLNAMNFQMIHELIDCTKDISTNEEIKCLILRGEGKAFCSGADLSSGEKKWKDTEESLIKGYWPIFDNIISMPKPVISSVRGAAAGIGSAYSMACDLTIMSKKSYLLQPFSNIGLIPDGGSHWLLYNMLGYKKAYQIAIENERISAEECLNIGLANKVVEQCEKESEFKFLYNDKTSLFKKIETIAKELYRASEVVADSKIRDQLKNFEESGYQSLPICIAKTQYSFSTDPNLKGAPSGHVLPIREVRLSSGAEFIVVVCGAIMTMPGLPKVPAADKIRINDKGETEGLF